MFNSKLKQALKLSEEQLLAAHKTVQNQNQELERLRAELQAKEDASAEEEVARQKQKAELQAEMQAIKQENQRLMDQYSTIYNLDKHIEERKDFLQLTNDELHALNEKYQGALKIFGELEKRVSLYQETLDLTDYGVYESRYHFELSEQYKLELESVYQKQKAMVSAGKAAYCTTEWTVGGSAAEGKKMTLQFTKLILYAFNGECDALIANIRWNNVTRIEERIKNAYTSINKLGQTQKVYISDPYLQLKLQELALNYEYQQKKFEEKEEQRRIREQMREEEKAQRDFEKAQKEAEDEEKRYQKALEKAQRELEANKNFENIGALQETVKELEAKLLEAHQQKERAISMAQQTKVGHIYVISNIGSFGDDVYKIGMTRRLDPNDRIRELGDASVPFYFDVHAIIYSENAPQLEHELHQRFKDHRLNKINRRKEFFKITLEEIESFVLEHTGAEIVFTKLADAKEFRETMALLVQKEVVVEPTTTRHDLPESLL